MFERDDEMNVIFARMNVISGRMNHHYGKMNDHYGKMNICFGTIAFKRSFFTTKLLPIKSHHLKSNHYLNFVNYQ